MKKSTSAKMTPARITAFLDTLKATENAQKFALEQLTIKIQEWEQNIKTIQDQLTTKSSELPSLKKEIEPKLKEIDSAITGYGKQLNTLSTDTIPEFDKKLGNIDAKHEKFSTIQACITNIKTHVTNQHARLTEFTTSFVLVKERYETPLHVEKLNNSTESLAASLEFLQHLQSPQASLTQEHRSKICTMSGKLTNVQQSLAALAKNVGPVTPSSVTSSEQKGAPHVAIK